jgi:hypothetical protein
MGEWLWLRRWRGESPRRIFTPEEFPDWAALEFQWNVAEKEQNAFLEKLTDDLLPDTSHTKISKMCAGNTVLLKCCSKW